MSTSLEQERYLKAKYIDVGDGLCPVSMFPLPYEDRKGRERGREE